VLLGRLVTYVQQSVKNVRRQSVRITLKEFENVSAFLNCTERKDMIVSFRYVDFTALWLHLCSVFPSVFTPGS